MPWLRRLHVANAPAVGFIDYAEFRQSLEDDMNGAIAAMPNLLHLALDGLENMDRLPPAVGQLTGLRSLHLRLSHLPVRALPGGSWLASLTSLVRAAGAHSCCAAGYGCHGWLLIFRYRTAAVRVLPTNVAARNLARLSRVASRLQFLGLKEALCEPDAASRCLAWAAQHPPLQRIAVDLEGASMNDTAAPAQMPHTLVQAVAFAQHRKPALVIDTRPGALDALFEEEE